MSNQNLQILSQACIELGLTKRETDCIYYLIRGMSAKQIGRELGLSNRTVETHLNNVKIKLNCHTRFELINKFIKDLLPNTNL